MLGFNKDYLRGSCKKKIIINSDIRWKYPSHPFLQEVFISKELSFLEFVLQDGKETKDYLFEIGDELERICFNIIAYTEIPTTQPVCEREQVINSDGTLMVFEDSLNIQDELTISMSVLQMI